MLVVSASGQEQRASLTFSTIGNATSVRSRGNSGETRARWEGSPRAQSDVQESQWLLKLHIFGLLRNSFHPPAAIRLVRTYWRQRGDHVHAISTCIERMRKVLTQMNIRLANVIGDLSGWTRQRVRAMLAGERNPASARGRRGADRRLGLFQLARRFSHEALLTPLAEGRDPLDGLHANTQIPKAIGFQRIAALTGDERYHRAARFFWRTVVDRRSFVTGGHGDNEHFFPPADFARHLVRENDGDVRYAQHAASDPHAVAGAPSAGTSITTSTPSTTASWRHRIRRAA